MSSIIDAVQKNNCRVLRLLVAVPGSVPQKQLDKALLEAVKSGFTECVKVLIGAGADPDVTDSCRNSALKTSVETGNNDIVQLLIEAKCSISFANRSGTKPLHCAARLGKDESTKLLLAAGANPDTVDNQGNTPLIYATQNSHLRLMKLLVEAKCNVNKANNESCTALHLASQKGLGVELLLQCHADANLQDCSGNTPLILAACEGLCNVLASLVKHCNVNIRNKQKRSAIHFMSMKGHGDCVQKLLLEGADADVPDGDGHTPLWHAIHRNRIDVIKMLLHTNCGLKSQKGESTPLQYALEQGEMDIVRMLLIAGCDAGCLNEWLNNENVPEEIKKDEELWHWLQEISSKPLPLRQLARHVVRLALGHDVVYKLHALPLPASMKEYVALKELDDYKVADDEDDN